MNLFTRTAVVLTVVVACWLPYTEGVAFCEQVGKAPCFNCGSTGKTCNALGDQIEGAQLCRDGTVCVETDGVGKCEDAEDTVCECDAFTTGCDPYDTELVTMCYINEGSGATTQFTPNRVQSCAVGEKCSDGQCPSQIPTTTTTSKPSTCAAANTNMRYPHETECKKYYTCREIKRGIYSYVAATCPSTYVFNPTTKYCDFPANVPTCQAP